MNQDDISRGSRRKAHGIKVTAHVHSDQSGRDAILGGVDSLEHASLLSDDTIRLAVERGVALSMDVYNGTYTIPRAENSISRGLHRAESGHHRSTTASI